MYMQDKVVTIFVIDGESFPVKTQLTVKVIGSERFNDAQLAAVTAAITRQVEALMPHGYEEVHGG